MRTQMLAAAAAMMLCAPGNTGAQTADHTLAGAWTSEPYELPLATEFDVSVWGPGATRVREVRLTVEPSGQAVLVVERRVVDGDGETVPPSVSVEEVRLTVGGPGETRGIRTDYAVEVTSAERRYPDDPEDRWPIEGLRVTLTSLERDGESWLEVRVDEPRGRDSFWQRLDRGGRSLSP